MTFRYIFLILFPLNSSPFASFSSPPTFVTFQDFSFSRSLSFSLSHPVEAFSSLRNFSANLPVFVVNFSSSYLLTFLIFFLVISPLFLTFILITYWFSIIFFPSLFAGFLVLREYLMPSRCRTIAWKLFHCLLFLSCFGGVICVIISRGHYLIDIILAYYVTTMVFWIYHTLVYNHSLLVITTLDDYVYIKAQFSMRSLILFTFLFRISI